MTTSPAGVRDDDLQPVAEEGDFDASDQLYHPHAYKRSAVAQPKRRSVGARKKSALLTVSRLNDNEISQMITNDSFVVVFASCILSVAASGNLSLISIIHTCIVHI